jgi:hypothetical protein
MHDNTATRTTERRRRPKYSAPTPEDDQILREGYDRATKHKAIQAVMSRHPDWTRDFVWKMARTLGLAKKTLQRPWSEEQTRQLMDMAGCDRVETISRVLMRSPKAIRRKLQRLMGRECALVTEAHSKQWVRQTLHTGLHRVNRLIEQGLLKLKNPAIKRASLEKFIEKLASTLGLQISADNRRRVLATRSAQSQIDIARELGVSVDEVKRWVSMNLLEPVDTHITALSFEKYCRTHPDDLRQELMTPEERDWFRTQLNVRMTMGGMSDNPRIRHLLIVRRCEVCLATIRGNAFFKHIKRCRQVNGSQPRVHVSRERFHSEKAG